EYLKDSKIKSKKYINTKTIEEDRRSFYCIKELPFRYTIKVIKKFNLKVKELISFNYKKIYNYLKKRVEVVKEVRLFNLKLIIKHFTKEIEEK
ncbi:uncharacterized protein SETTUDRAFT_88939, partial [Exserohilum turcica Et28A]